MGGLDELSAYVIMAEGLMAPQPIHGVGGVAELSYGMIYTTNKKSALRSPWFDSVSFYAHLVDTNGNVNFGNGVDSDSYGQSLSGPSGFTKWLFYQSVWLHCIR